MGSKNYYLSIGDGKSKVLCLFSNLFFLVHFGEKMGVAAMRAPKPGAQ